MSRADMPVTPPLKRGRKEWQQPSRIQLLALIALTLVASSPSVVAGTDSTKLAPPPTATLLPSAQDTWVRTKLETVRKQTTGGGDLLGAEDTATMLSEAEKWRTGNENYTVDGEKA
jgi:hypothetical protein